jgi:drug/metabolite transporter (DMT)-like permease
MTINQIFHNGHQGLARVACLLGGAVWGLYWIPLRTLDSTGISGAWASALFNLIALLIIAPLILIRLRPLLAGGLQIQLTGATLGLTLLVYATAFLYTDVVHAILLYYLTPIWGALFGRLWLKEKISPDQLVGIGFGIVGMMVILHIDEGFPWPRNIGDWMALSAGILWALGATMTRRFPEQHTLDIVSTWFLWCTIFAVIAGLLFQGSQSVPDLATIIPVVYWTIPIVALIVVPTFVAITWGLPQLNPGTSGLLFMTEISVVTVSAAILTDEHIGVREILGVVLISLAGLAEVVLPRLRRAN